MQLAASIIGALVGLLAWPTVDAQVPTLFGVPPAITLLATMVVAGGAARFLLQVALAGKGAQAWVRKMKLSHFGDLRGDKVLPFLGAATLAYVGYLFFDGLPLPAPTLGLAAMAFTACIKGTPLLDDPWPPQPRRFRLELPDAKRAAEELGRVDPKQIRPCRVQLEGWPVSGDPSRVVKKSTVLHVRAFLLKPNDEEPDAYDIEGAARIPEVRALAYAIAQFAAKAQLGPVETANVVIRLVLDPDNVKDTRDSDVPRSPVVVLSTGQGNDAERAWTAAAILTALGMKTLLLELDRRGRRKRYAVAIPSPIDLGGRMLSVAGRPHLWGAIRPDGPVAFGEPPEGQLGEWVVIEGAPTGARVHVTG